MKFFRTVSTVNSYGPLQPSFSYDLRTGYTALLGPNNVGKSAILQLVFQALLREGEVGPRRIALVLPDRHYVEPTTQTGGRTLEVWNNELAQYLGGAPLVHGPNYVGPPRSELARVLMHGNLIAQFHAMNDLLVRLDLRPFELRDAQNIQFEDVLIFFQGSGLRAAFQILAALTNPEVRVILIDEPELSLEPRLQKVLREVLIEAAADRVIVTATHSHLFVRRDLIEANQVVSRNELNETVVHTLAGPGELYDVVFDLLGSSTEDLFFPGNYLIVEGASDQAIVVRVLELLGAPPPTIKVLAARGIDSVRDAVGSVYRASVPLIVNDSPYAGRVVALIDEPADPESANVRKLASDLGDRLYTLGEPSIEKYLPEPLYDRASRDKAQDLAELERLRSDRGARDALKRELATALAEVLTEADLESIPVITQAARRAIAEST